MEASPWNVHGSRGMVKQQQDFSQAGEGHHPRTTCCS